MVLIVNPDCLTTVERGEGVVLNSRTGRFLGLNRTALAIWESLLGGRQPEEIIAEYAERFHVPMETAKKDVDRIIRDFSRKGLVTAKD